MSAGKPNITAAAAGGLLGNASTIGFAYLALAGIGPVWLRVIAGLVTVMWLLSGAATAVGTEIARWQAEAAERAAVLNSIFTKAGK